MFDAKRKVRLCRLLALLLALVFAVSVYYAFASIVSRQCPHSDDWFHQTPLQSSYHGNHDAFRSVVDRVSVVNTILRGGVGAGGGHQPHPPASGTSPATGYFAGSPSASDDVLASVPSGYKRAVTEREALVFLDLLLTLDHVTRRNNITCYMNYGTLLGSFRHHAMIPWDDDADVAMPYADKAQVWALLNEIASSEPNILGGEPDRAQGDGVRGGYTVNITADTQFRFTGRESRQHSPSWPWRWPYVDIDFYFENATHIWLYNSGAVYRYHRDAVFPLHARPLGPISLSAPRDTRRYLSETFPDYDSCSTGMQHKLGQERLVESRPCETLEHAYPFVHRSLTWNNVVWETLKLGNASLYSMVVNEPPSSARVSPFTLKDASV